VQLCQSISVDSLEACIEEAVVIGWVRGIDESVPFFIRGCFHYGIDVRETIG
jgi:hypothetical protein